MASGHTGNVVPGNRLRVRLPCPPLQKHRRPNKGEPVAERFQHVHCLVEPVAVRGIKPIVRVCHSPSPVVDLTYERRGYSSMD
jgi:hypothetical protein